MGPRKCIERSSKIPSSPLPLATSQSPVPPLVHCLANQPRLQPQREINMQNTVRCAFREIGSGLIKQGCGCVQG